MEDDEKGPRGARTCDEKWNAWLEKLRDFKREHGHCDVPGRPVGLGNWVRSQRVARRKGLKRLTPGRIRKLDEEGFSWSLRDPRAILGESGANDAPMEEGEEDSNVERGGAGIGEVAGSLGDTFAPARPGGNKDEGNASKIIFSMRHTSSGGEEEAPPKRLGELEASAEPEGVPESELGHAAEAHKGEMERRLSDIASMHRAQVEDLKKMHSEGLRGAREEYEGRLASLRGELKDEYEGQLRSLRDELKEAREHATPIQSMHHAQVDDLRKMHSEGLRGAREEYEGRLASLRGEMKDEYEGQLRSLRDELKEAREHATSIQSVHRLQLDDLKEMHSKGVRDAREEYEGWLASLRRELKDEYGGQLRNLRDDLREAREHVTSLQGQLKSALGDPEVCVSM